MLQLQDATADDIEIGVNCQSAIKINYARWLVRSYFYALDIFRFLAALAVAVFHLAFYAWAAPHSTTGRMFSGVAELSFLAPWAWPGWIGVQLFFVISGFVIANSANATSPLEFAKSRVLRLYPAAWICASITLTALVLAHTPGEGLLPNYLRSLVIYNTGPWVDGVYWTLVVEISFYFLIFLLLVFRGFAKLHRVAWGLTLAGGAYLVWFVLILDGGELVTNWIVKIVNLSDLLLLRHGPFFAVGIWLWMASQRLMTTSRWMGLAVSVLCCCLEVVLRTCEMRNEVPDWVTLPVGIPLAIWLISVAALFIFTSDPARFVPRNPGTRQTLILLGKMTYPLYLLHNVVGAGVMRALIVNGVDAWLALLLALGAVILLSFFVCVFWEPSLRAHLRRAFEIVEVAVLRRLSFCAFLFHPGGRLALRPPHSHSL